jgi:hypothetical protein
MFYSELGSLQSRVDKARQADDLFFANLLPRDTIRGAFGEASGILDRARIYDTAVTVWVFLAQVLSPDHGCVAAVARLIVYRIACGLAACCAQTGAYCLARDQLDEQALQRLLKQTGVTVEEQAPDDWLWLGHRVVTADGTTVTMPDTAENQAAYPQLSAQAPGCGFPILRMVVFFAISTGVVLEMALGKYRGKLTHEVSLFREIDACIAADNVFLADRAYAGWFDMARLIGRGVHVVVRKHQLRTSDFRTGRRLGHDDHVIELEKPQRPEWMSDEEYQSYPDRLEIRELRIRVQQKGFRTREIIVHTSLLDDVAYRQEDIAALFRRRWQAELHLRSLKTVMQMEHLRCKKPHRVRNEIRAHDCLQFDPSTDERGGACGEVAALADQFQKHVNDVVGSVTGAGDDSRSRGPLSRVVGLLPAAPRRRPPRPLRAKSGQAAPQTIQTHAETTPPIQTR